MCQNQTTFWACNDLASGRFLICEKYRATLGRECEGYTSFARRINLRCSKCHTKVGQTPRADLKAGAKDERAIRGVKRKEREIDGQSQQPKQEDMLEYDSNLSKYPLLAATAREIEQQAKADAKPSRAPEAVMVVINSTECF